MTKPHLLSHPLYRKRVFLRADLNVPIQDGVILNDFRLKAVQPTLDHLVACNARIVVGTHRGRPVGIEPALSTRALIPWFLEKGYSLRWTETIEQAIQLSQVNAPRSLILLENLRFHQEEHEPSVAFAQKLRQLGDFYINDAFSVLHRRDASITSLPALYDFQDKSVGFLVDKELESLSIFRQPSRRPFVLIMGGGKVKDKLPYCEALLEHVDTLIILPAIACTFLKAQGYEVGRSLVEESMIELSRTILKKAQHKGVKVMLPLDYLVEGGSVGGPLYILSSIPSDGRVLAIGPRSLALYEEELSTAQMIFFNGAMGLKERVESLEPLYRLLTIIAHSTAYTGVGGGDTVA
ncbi:phosphoglycerate kinase, partial [Candidatus Dependentiae bacterium]|nr:phosphoglycerate kinase [Candidatus Dependentiae bacterium]